jgi:hypothetical protein
MISNIKGIAREAAKGVGSLRELDNLVKAIGECKSKAEEDRIILNELETLKQRLSDPKLDRSRGREYMVRVMYCEMLGHDASFAYIPCLQFASDANLLTKKVRRPPRTRARPRGAQRPRSSAAPLRRPRGPPPRRGRPRRRAAPARAIARGGGARRPPAIPLPRHLTPRPRLPRPPTPTLPPAPAQAAYLALTQLLHHNHELVLLLVNTLLSDLKSDNFVVACSALVVTCKLIGPDLVSAVFPIVVGAPGQPGAGERSSGSGPGCAAS